MSQNLLFGFKILPYCFDLPRAPLLKNISRYEGDQGVLGAGLHANMNFL